MAELVFGMGTHYRVLYQGPLLCPVPGTSASRRNDTGTSYPISAFEGSSSARLRNHAHLVW